MMRDTAARPACGLRCIPDNYLPVPCSPILTFPQRELSKIFRKVFAGPAWLGLKVTVTLHACLGDRTAGQLLLSENGPVPSIAMPPIKMLAPPFWALLVSWMLRWRFAPTGTLPKVSGAGRAFSTARGVGAAVGLGVKVLNSASNCVMLGLPQPVPKS